MLKLFIVLHHTGDPTQGPQFDKVNLSHKNRGFPKSSLGYYVGYQYFIGYNGIVKQSRQESEVGAHCAAKFMNYIGIGVCLAGDFTTGKPNPEQIDALEKLVGKIQERWSIPFESILLHRECKPTACPGVDLREAVRLRREEISAWERYRDTDNPMVRRALSRRIARILRWMSRI